MAEHAPIRSDRFADDDPMLPATTPCRDRVRSALGTLIAAAVILGLMLLAGYLLGEELHG